MREILFRGKRADNGEWVEGFYVRLFEKVNGFYKTKHYVFDGNTKLGEERYCGHGNYEQNVEICKFEVIPETIGQYTGLTDKNGKKIFEGDIIKHEWISMSNEKYKHFENFKVEYNECAFFAVPIYPSKNVWTVYLFAKYGDNTKYEVIGSIHDNSELLK